MSSIIMDVAPSRMLALDSSIIAANIDQYVQYDTKLPKKPLFSPRPLKAVSFNMLTASDKNLWDKWTAQWRAQNVFVIFGQEARDCVYLGL